MRTEYEELIMAPALERAASLIDEKGDVKNASRLQTLAQKVRERELVIAFCGHFSAGKSSMINY